MIKNKEEITVKTELNDSGEIKLHLHDLADFKGANPKLRMFSHAVLNVGEEVEFHIHNGESIRLIEGGVITCVKGGQPRGYSLLCGKRACGIGQNTVQISQRTTLTDIVYSHIEEYNVGSNIVSGVTCGSVIVIQFKRTLGSGVVHSGSAPGVVYAKLHTKIV